MEDILGGGEEDQLGGGSLFLSVLKDFACGTGHKEESWGLSVVRNFSCAAPPTTLLLKYTYGSAGVSPL